MLRSGQQKPGPSPRGTTVPVTRPVDLAAVQIATRKFCRAIDYDDGDVCGAVIGVSELAHSMLVETPRDGAVRLRAVKVRGGYALEAQVTRAEGGPEDPSASDSVTIRPPRTFHRDH